MLRRTLFLTLLAAVGLTPCFAAAVDGAWVIARKTKKETVEFELTLKADGGTLTGTYGRKGRRRTQDIADGKIAGDKISFTTVQRSKKGETKILWTGAVGANQIKGETKREGANRARPFTAKKQ